jgi:hypothetical protein
MLFLPKGELPPKKNGAGYARGRGASGHWLRARAAVVNTNTDSMSRWRHLFNVAKINFKATQPGGRNTAPVLGITPFEAWFYQSATYVGIVLAGLYEGGSSGYNTQSFKLDSSGNPYFPQLKSTTGTRFLCIDTSGEVHSSATACSGT